MSGQHYEMNKSSIFQSTVLMKEFIRNSISRKKYMTWLQYTTKVHSFQSCLFFLLCAQWVERNSEVALFLFPFPKLFPRFSFLSKFFTDTYSANFFFSPVLSRNYKKITIISRIKYFRINLTLLCNVRHPGRGYLNSNAAQIVYNYSTIAGPSDPGLGGGGRGEGGCPEIYM